MIHYSDWSLSAIRLWQPFVRLTLICIWTKEASFLKTYGLLGKRYISPNPQKALLETIKMVDAPRVLHLYSKGLRLLICNRSFSLGGSAGKCHRCSLPLKLFFLLVAHNQCRGQGCKCKGSGNQSKLASEVWPVLPMTTLNHLLYPSVFLDVKKKTGLNKGLHDLLNLYYALM